MSGLEASLRGSHKAWARHRTGGRHQSVPAAPLVELSSQGVLPVGIKCCSTGLSGDCSSLHAAETGVDGLPLPAGINAAQWNYQRDGAANNAWEDRKELLMDWSSSVVSTVVGSFLCRFFSVAHTPWPTA